MSLHYLHKRQLRLRPPTVSLRLTTYPLTNGANLPTTGDFHILTMVDRPQVTAPQRLGSGSCTTINEFHATIRGACKGPLHVSRISCGTEDQLTGDQCHSGVVLKAALVPWVSEESHFLEEKINGMTMRGKCTKSVTGKYRKTLSTKTSTPKPPYGSGLRFERHSPALL